MVDATKQRFQIAFGALADRIANQLRKGRISGWKAKDAKRWQHVADAITTCFLHRMITSSQADAARQRLVKRIGQELSDGK
jgi:hypothetical protein